MALLPPPPPTKSEPGSFAWMDWYRSLYAYISGPTAVSWVNVSKAGSNLADLQTRLHSSLQSVLGTGQYHLSATEQARVTVVTTVQSKATDPTTADITASNWALYKNTTSGTVKLWANDGGTLKSVALT